MRSLVIVLAGFVVLAVCLLIGRLLGGASKKALAKAALVFIVVWLALTALNMWIGVTQAGYSVAEELPIFALLFAIPAVAAVILWRRFSRNPNP
jgi:hypothetical protein